MGLKTLRAVEDPKTLRAVEDPRSGYISFAVSFSLFFNLETN